MASPNPLSNVSTSGQLRWPRYFPRQVVTASDLNAGQAYFIERLRRHNRFLHGFGVVYGLDVEKGTPSSAGPTVQVAAGYAISPNGDEILVLEPQTVTIDCVENLSGDCTDLNATPAADPEIYLVLRYLPQPTCAIPALPGYCDPNMICEDSRWQEGYTFACVDELPPPYQTQIDCDVISEDFADQRIPSLVTLPTGDDVLLACLTLQRGEDGTVNDVLVDVSCRRVLYGTASLQEVIRCLPTAPPAVPTVVSSIAPSNNAQLVTPPGQIRIVFSKALQPLSVTADSIQVFRTLTNAPTAGSLFPGTVSYDPASHSAIFIPDTAFPAGNTFTVTVRGDPPNAIVDIDNLRLDGEPDGVQGGNFQSRFMVLQIEPHFHDFHEFHHFIEPHDFHIHEPHDFHVHETHNIHQIHNVHAHELHELHEIHHFAHGFQPTSPVSGDVPAESGPGPFHIPVEAVPGITPAMAAILRANQINTAADLAGRPEADIAGLLNTSQDAAELLNRIARDLSAG